MGVCVFILLLLCGTRVGRRLMDIIREKSARKNADLRTIGFELVYKKKNHEKPSKDRCDNVFVTCDGIRKNTTMLTIH